MSICKNCMTALHDETNPPVTRCDPELAELLNSNNHIAQAVGKLLAGRLVMDVANSLPRGSLSAQLAEAGEAMIRSALPQFK